MIDLVCLVADKSMEAAVASLLKRSEALKIRPIEFETLVHPHRDSGCFSQHGELLRGYTDIARHALVVLDRAWDGAPTPNGTELEAMLQAALRAIGPTGWAEAVVIDPELDVWVFSDSPHVASALGWPGSVADLRGALQDAGKWDEGAPKPADPKAALSWLLREAGRPRSSAIFREIAAKVGLGRCEDGAFLRLKERLRGWFGADHAHQ